MGSKWSGILSPVSSVFPVVPFGSSRLHRVQAPGLSLVSPFIVGPRFHVPDLRRTGLCRTFQVSWVPSAYSLCRGSWSRLSRIRTYNLLLPGQADYQFSYKPISPSFRGVSVFKTPPFFQGVTASSGPSCRQLVAVTKSLACLSRCRGRFPTVAPRKRPVAIFAPIATRGGFPVSGVSPDQLCRSFPTVVVLSPNALVQGVYRF